MRRPQIDIKTKFIDIVKLLSNAFAVIREISHPKEHQCHHL